MEIRKPTKPGPYIARSASDNSIDIGGDALLAEEAMETTREILKGEMT